MRGKTRNAWFKGRSLQPILFPPKSECLPGLIKGDIFVNYPESEATACQVWVFGSLQTGVWLPTSWGYQNSNGERLMVGTGGKLLFVSEPRWEAANKSQMGRIIYR